MWPSLCTVGIGRNARLVTPKVRSGEFDETRRGWKKCGCLIHVSGTLGGKFKRKQTGKANWDDAKAVAAIWEKAQHWDGEQNAALDVPRVDLPMVQNGWPESPAQSITIAPGLSESG
jgi:hypothetical protein